ncbi:PREDICTED: EPIDERMAL PATTERNING FACTOR-like protein 1 [Fragaria vesca subsp. vesca]|uniref:EPIDERMAL PATTERNING FACTOR-like protein 1 n=1 Tax=Fragaria vesca subsp. vesca TaxID=101020 RepID=UPI0002C343EE|nr:PREDICTED: EPIDERMAL PATTERNING FACTOR-like protein 1 [Fragaria vesca subsp. vesca]
MKGISYWFVIALQIMSWVSATSRLFPPSNGLDVHEAGSGQNPHQSSQVTLEQELANSTGGEAKMNEIANFRGGSKIGSSPPSCENKCYGCTPCEAIQVPTNTKKLNHFRVQYANYEPEGWKCKCGPSFYSP